MVSFLYGLYNLLPMRARNRVILNILFFMVFLMYIPYAEGDIQVSIQEKKNFNLGDILSSSASIKTDENIAGFIKIELHCLNYQLPFYTAPLIVEAGFRTMVDIPKITLPKSSEGKCRLRADFDNSDGSRIDSSWSEYFFVETELTVHAEDKLDGKPGEKLAISAHARNLDDQLVEEAEAIISFSGKEEKVKLISGLLNYELPIKEDLKPGEYKIYLTIEDDYGNVGYKQISVTLEAVPTSIKIDPDNRNINPGEKVKIKFSLNDQSGSPIENKSLEIELIDPLGKVLIRKDVVSNAYLELETNITQEPGTYNIIAIYQDIKEESEFIIQEVKKILMIQDGYNIHISNDGNLIYEDEVTIVLEDGDKKFLINRDIKLEPGEKISIDLSREVPQGIYDIQLPVTDEQTINKNVSNKLEGVNIEDNRNIVKKATHGFSLVTGAVTRTTGYITSKPLLAGFILVLIIAGIILHYSWGFIRARVLGKEENSTENIFDDFKFGDEEGPGKNENNRS
jgi:5-hydroxyisourate hydrolase-like protein (transthyretin family)